MKRGDRDASAMKITAAARAIGIIATSGVCACSCLKTWYEVMSCAREMLDHRHLSWHAICGEWHGREITTTPRAHRRANPREMHGRVAADNTWHDLY